MELVFRALADPSRREILDRLNERNGQSLSELCAGLDMRRQSVSKHLAVLQAANLVTTQRRGREKLHYLNPAPINEIAERWIRRYDRSRIEALADMKRALEETGMAETDFVYVSYIRSTPERVWQALTDPGFTQRYWDGFTIETGWSPGEPMVWTNDDLRFDDPQQRVLAYEPHACLAFTWFRPTAAFAAKFGLPAEWVHRVRAEPPSNVTFSIVAQGDVVELTVVHAGFQPASAMFEAVRAGWPHIISRLKTLLETGDIPAGMLTPAAGARASATHPEASSAV